MTPMTLLDRIQNIDGNALPVAADRRSVLLGIEGEDATLGYLMVCPDEVAGGVAITVYDFDTWQHNGAPEALLHVDTDDAAVNAVEYLVTCQPEGTDWCAWACQRIADDGADIGINAAPDPDPDLAAQWQDSAPDMDYDDWLIAEIDIQTELLDDIPDDDQASLDATTTIACGFAMSSVAAGLPSGRRRST